MTRLTVSLSALIAGTALMAAPAMAERCAFKTSQVMASVPEKAPVSTPQAATTETPATETPAAASAADVAQSSVGQTRAN